MTLRTMAKKLGRLEALARRRNDRNSRDLRKYRDDPVGYVRKVLKMDPTPKQQEFLVAAYEPPHRLLISSGHDVGKTCGAAMLLNHFYDTHDPGIGITTAPKLEQVKDLLWKEVRAQRERAGLGDFAGPKSLRLESSHLHFAKGTTANVQAGFQGQHEANVCIIIDEAEDVERYIFEAAKTMAMGPGNLIVCFYNPYTTTSHVAQEEQALDERGKPSWRLMTMSSLDHPNILAELRGEPPPFPKAVRLAKVQGWVNDWCQRIDAIDAKATDIEWPPGSGKWYRPGPRFEAGALGRRPTQAVDSVWSVALVDACIKRVLPQTGPLQIGIDCARFGDDDSAFHVRKGGVSLAHQAVNGWNCTQIIAHAMRLASHWGGKFGIPANRVPIAVDDCGIVGVVDGLHERGFNVFGVNAASSAPESSPDEERYPNLRSALWFDLADEGQRGNVSFAELPFEVQQQLRRELPAQQYRMDTRGRRVCLDKAITKQALGRSPDNADGVLLAYCLVDVVGDRVGGRVAIPGGM